MHADVPTGCIFALLSGSARLILNSSPTSVRNRWLGKGARHRIKNFANEDKYKKDPRVTIIIVFNVLCTSTFIEVEKQHGSFAHTPR
jgi:hypothetical protein